MLINETTNFGQLSKIRATLNIESEHDIRFKAHHRFAIAEGIGATREMELGDAQGRQFMMECIQ